MLHRRIFKCCQPARRLALAGRQPRSLHDARRRNHDDLHRRHRGAQRLQGAYDDGYLELNPPESRGILGDDDNSWQQTSYSFDKDGNVQTVTTTAHYGFRDRVEDTLKDVADRAQAVQDAMGSQESDALSKGDVAGYLGSHVVGELAGIVHLGANVPRYLYSNREWLPNTFTLANEAIHNFKTGVEDKFVTLGTWGQKQGGVVGGIANVVGATGYIGAQFLPDNVVEAGALLAGGPLGELAGAGIKTAVSVGSKVLDIGVGATKTLLPELAPAITAVEGWASAAGNTLTRAASWNVGAASASAASRVTGALVDVADAGASRVRTSLEMASADAIATGTTVLRSVGDGLSSAYDGVAQRLGFGADATAIGSEDALSASRTLASDGTTASGRAIVETGGDADALASRVGGDAERAPVPRDEPATPRVDDPVPTQQVDLIHEVPVGPNTPATPITELGNATADELGTLRGMGSRGVRNSSELTATQQEQLYQHVDEMGLNRDDFLISSHVSAYSDTFDKVLLGPNMFPAGEDAGAGAVNSVFETMSPRAAVAHEAGHMLTTRAGTDFEAGSMFDEVNASLTGRELPGLSNVDRYQLLRDAAERSQAEGQGLRDTLQQMQALRTGAGSTATLGTAGADVVDAAALAPVGPAPSLSFTTPAFDATTVEGPFSLLNQESRPVTYSQFVDHVNTNDLSGAFTKPLPDIYSDVYAVPKADRPDISTYLDPSYVTQHLQKFGDQGGFIFTDSDIANPLYTTFSPNKFLTSGAEMNDINAEFQATGNVSDLESTLGYDPNYLAGKEIYSYSVNKPSVVMPNGTERGAYPVWLPGGLTYPGGLSEAVLDNVPIFHGNDVANLPNVLRLK